MTETEIDAVIAHAEAQLKAVGIDASDREAVVRLLAATVIELGRHVSMGMIRRGRG